MKKQAKRKLIVGREVVKALTDLGEVKGGMIAKTACGCEGCSELRSGCGIVTWGG